MGTVCAVVNQKCSTLIVQYTTRSKLMDPRSIPVAPMTVEDAVEILASLRSEISEARSTLKELREEKKDLHRSVAKFVDIMNNNSDKLLERALSDVRKMFDDVKIAANNTVNQRVEKILEEFDKIHKAIDGLNKEAKRFIRLYSDAGTVLSDSEGIDYMTKALHDRVGDLFLATADDINKNLKRRRK